MNTKKESEGKAMGMIVRSKIVKITGESAEVQDISFGGRYFGEEEDVRAAAREWIANLKAAGLHGRVFLGANRCISFYPSEHDMETRRKAFQAAESVELFRRRKAAWAVCPVFHVHYSFGVSDGNTYEESIPFPTLDGALKMAAELANARVVSGEPAYVQDDIFVYGDDRNKRVQGKALWKLLRMHGYDMEF